MKLKRWEKWKVDGRKGLLSIQLLQSVDTEEDQFFHVKILEGVAKYASHEHRLMQQADGMGMPGSAISLRTTLTHFKERVK